MQEVARDKQYSNDMLRKAEIARRLKETEGVRELDKEIASTKTEIASLEITAEKIKWELRNTQALIQLAAAAVQAGNQEVLVMLTGQEAKQEVPQEEKQEKANGKNSNLTEMTVKILGAMPGRKEGVVKALVQDKDCMAQMAAFDDNLTTMGCDLLPPLLAGGVFLLPEQGVQLCRRLHHLRVFPHFQEQRGGSVKETHVFPPLYAEIPDR